jgi:ankyrin repeat protein
VQLGDLRACGNAFPWCQELGAKYEMNIKVRQIILGVVALTLGLFCAASFYVVRLFRTGLALIPPALHKAALAGNSPEVKRLLNLGQDPNLRDDRGGTPIFYALGAEKWNTAEVLLKAGAKLDVADDGKGFADLNESRIS